ADCLQVAEQVMHGGGPGSDRPVHRIPDPLDPVKILSCHAANVAKLSLCRNRFPGVVEVQDAGFEVGTGRTCGPGQPRRVRAPRAEESCWWAVPPEIAWLPSWQGV